MKKEMEELIRLFQAHGTVPLSQGNVPEHILRELKRLFAKRNPYGYCSGYNYQTCRSMITQKHNSNNECPYIKYGVHCGENI